jgi:DNA-binding transcriptional LysR family regulator
LSITPSAVSHALARLRHLFNDPLFVRIPGGMRATARGSEIGTRLRDGLHQLEAALTPTSFQAEESARTFTVVCSAYVSAVLLPGVIARIRQVAPKAGLAVRPWNAGVVEQLVSGQIDLLLGDFVRVPAGLECQALFADRAVWLVGRDYVLPTAQNARQLRVEGFNRITPHLASPTVLESGVERRVALDECCGIVGNPVGDAPGSPILESLPYAAIAPLVVKHADLAALLPRRLALLFARDFGLDVVDLPPGNDALGIRIGAAWHFDHGSRPPVAWLRNLLVEVASKLGFTASREVQKNGC